MPKLKTDESGSVAAEFVVVLPTVILILAISLGALSATVERIRLVSVAAGVARALARAEPIEKVRQIYSSQLSGRKLDISESGELICAKVGLRLKLPGIPDFDLRLAETQCARQVGL